MRGHWVCLLPAQGRKCSPYGKTEARSNLNHEIRVSSLPLPPKSARSWNRILQFRAPTVSWVSMWKITFVLRLFTKETTAHLSFPAVNHLMAGSVSAGEMRRRHCTVPLLPRRHLEEEWGQSEEACKEVGISCPCIVVVAPSCWCPLHQDAALSAHQVHSEWWRALQGAKRISFVYCIWPGAEGKLLAVLWPASHLKKKNHWNFFQGVGFE